MEYAARPWGNSQCRPELFHSQKVTVTFQAAADTSVQPAGLIVSMVPVSSRCPAGGMSRGRRRVNEVYARRPWKGLCIGRGL